MSKIQRNKKQKTTENDQNNENQTSISKYFFKCSSQPSIRKRISPALSDSIPCTKLLKLSSNEGNGVSETFQLQRREINNGEPVSSNMNSDIEITKCNENKLKSFTYYKHTKSKEESDLKALEKPYSSKSSFLQNISYFDKYIENASDYENCKKEVYQDGSLFQTVLNYTPLEKQYLDFQAIYPDAVLLIECGYKYRFFGKDAEIASRDLNIGCYQYHSFLSASIPVHRLQFYVRRLVIKGYKVGVIKQTESAALKAAGDTRNELFSRELYAMYTKSTFIDGDLDIQDDDKSVEVDDTDENDTGSGYLMCIYEGKTPKNQSDISVAVVAVQIKSGDIFYSFFQANLNESEIESCLLCINPSEIVISSAVLSKMTENLLKTFNHDRSVRIERLDEKVFEHSFALNSMSSFISSDKSSTLEDEDNLQTLLSLPPSVVSCLSALKVYLSEFKVENILKNVKNMRPFSTNDCLTLNAATIKGLEILKSNFNFSNYGTLFWCMNQTLTKFGERLMKLWIIKPLKDIQKIEERLNIVTEIIQSNSLIFQKISKMLHKLPDLEKLLCSTFYHKCNCYDFFKLIQALTNIQNELVGLTDKIMTELQIIRLKDILLDIIKCLEGIERYSSNIDPVAAKEGNKVNIFQDTTMFTSVETCKVNIADIEKKLSDLRPSICKILKLPGFKYSTVSGQKFLIEVPNSHLSVVPNDWLKISATKQVSRFRSPEVIALCREWDQEQARLIECANVVWDQFLGEFGEEFYKCKRAISYLAELDCYFSFAKLSKDEGYCRPIITNSNYRNFDVKQGRHPVVVKLMGEENQFVANDIKLNSVERCVIITGPNMGGKSTYVRQVAIISIMAHLGCYVPASSATVPLLDGIFVRMGADDDLVHKKSTFMSEMCEASNILSTATSKSLVILDELGRGTSTNDGAAIAYATVEHLIRDVQCFSLFVTHYPAVVELKTYYPENISTVCMAYILKDIDDNDDDIQTVTFLYNIELGVSEKSYGINVAALAGISKNILIEAQKKSREMELKMAIQRKLENALLKFESKSSSGKNEVQS